MGELSISERICLQRRRISDAAIRSGRDPCEVTIVAASKKQSESAIREAYAAGQRDFGENYVQELVEKAESLADLPDIRWHMIGHLQSKKCRLIAGIVHRVHTVDSSKLAREISKRASEASRGSEPLGVLIEVNLDGEESKSGCRPEEVLPLFLELENLPHITPVGLMTMPRAESSLDQAKCHFQQLLKLRELHPELRVLKELSIGMSADAEVAVECGATYVRIGTALFGERPPLEGAPEGVRAADRAPAS
jgi:pyridoxal phosphate enzyme (YggS family)